MTDDPTRGTEWSALDSAASPERLLGFLDAVTSLPPVAAAKRRSFELLGAAPGRRLLDAGCGTGADVLALAARVAPGGEVVGLDSSATAIATARERARGREGVRFERADLAELPFPDAEFDGARADRSVQHCARPEAAVAELVRVTRPGGAVVISEATFSVPRGGTPPTGGEALSPFLPLLLRRSGADQIALERWEDTIDPGPEVLAELGVDAGPIELRIGHVTARVRVGA